LIHVSQREWVSRSACRTQPTATFYPDMSAGRESAYDAAKAICATCPVAGPCLDFAWPPQPSGSVGCVMFRGRLRRLGDGEEFGCWSGTLPSERGFGDKRKTKEAEPGSDPCDHCGKLIRKTGIKKYCGERCQRAAARKPVESDAPHLDLGPEIRRCAFCGGQYEKTKPRQRHCSTECVRNSLMGRAPKMETDRQEPPVTVYMMEAKENEG
jgi:hypothetical protein